MIFANENENQLVRHKCRLCRQPSLLLTEMRYSQAKGYLGQDSWYNRSIECLEELLRQQWQGSLTTSLDSPRLIVR